MSVKRAPGLQTSCSDLDKDEKLPRAQFNKNVTCYQYRKSHCGDKVILLSSLASPAVRTKLSWQVVVCSESHYDGCVMQGSFYACAQPMRDAVIMQRCLSLAGRIHKMIPDYVISKQQDWDKGRTEMTGDTGENHTIAHPARTSFAHTHWFECQHG